MQIPERVRGGIPLPEARARMTAVSAAEVVSEDLDTIVEDLADEFALLAGKRLLVTGGAGFLGYYLVQAALRSNDDASQRADPRHGLRQLRPRPSRVARAARRATTHLALVRHDIRQPLPDDIGDFEYVIHAAGIASPTYYRMHPIETMDANINGLRSLLDCVARAARARTTDRGLPLLLEQRDLRRPDPRRTSRRPRPTAATSPAPARAPATTSRSASARPCASTSPAQHGVPVADRPAVQQLRPRPEDHRPPRDPRLRARHARRPRHRHALRRLGDADLLLRRRRRRRATTRSWSRGRAGEAYNIGIEEPEISMARARRAARRRSAGSCSATRASVVAAGERANATTSSTTRTAAARSSTRRDEHLGYEPKVPLDDGLRRSLHLVRREPRGGGRLMRVAIVGSGYVGLVTGACLAEQGSRRHRHRPGRGKVEHDHRRARARSTRRGSTSCSSATSASGLRATTDLAEAVRAPT